MKGGEKMSIHIYANLAPQGWTDLSSEDSTRIESKSGEMVRPYVWWEEEAFAYYPFQRDCENSLYQYPYVMVSYKGKCYRVNLSLFQIVED